ncbi:MAG: hypothetical protein LBQ36_06305 [Synergistaceae bacterium]|jgi:hypothetical protein|nr:hypothetical protein [Synergistaceae bacterium]
MKRLLTVICVLSLSAIFACQACAADDLEGETVQQRSLERVESVVYGAPGSGGMLIRLARVERDLFGMELPGTLTERQQALLNFVETGTPTQPSLIFKIGVAEWVTLSKVNPSVSLSDRIANLETTLEGETQAGALSSRLERILTKLLPSGVTSLSVQIPAGTVFKAAFAKTLTVRTVKVGDIVELNVTEDCITDGTLAVAKGDRVFAEVTKVRLPRSFGRTSEIGVEFREIESLGGELFGVTMGERAKKAMQIDSGTIGAVGTSLVGAILVGPLGLAGGFLVRGNDKQIPEGSLVYVETVSDAGVTGYPTFGASDPANGNAAPQGEESPDFVPIDDGASQGPPTDSF